MGKRKKRLTMAKYAKKYAAIRTRIGKQEAAVDEPTTPQTKTEEVLQAVAETVPVVAEIKQAPAKEIVKEVPVEPVLAQKEEPQPPEIVEEIALETIKTTKVEKTVSKKTATRKRNPSNRVKAGTRVAKSKRSKAKG
jgi:hypothetical protein